MRERSRVRSPAVPKKSLFLWIAIRLQWWNECGSYCPKKQDLRYGGINSVRYRAVEDMYKTLSIHILGVLVRAWKGRRTLGIYLLSCEHSISSWDGSARCNKVDITLVNTMKVKSTMILISLDPLVSQHLVCTSTVLDYVWVRSCW